jgi:hypothetical protein
MVHKKTIHRKIKMTKSITILGSHNGFDLIRKDTGEEIYWNKETGKTAIGIRGLARLLDCDPKTIARKVVTQNLGLELEMYTTSGLKVVTLVEENDLNKLFSAILDSKVKQETKENVKVVQDKLVQAGFRLGALLQIAPEAVAKEAISRIESSEAAADVADYAVKHKNYLDSFHGLNAAGKACNFKSCHYGQVHGFNNQITGVKNGARDKATRYQKAQLTVIQTMQALKLEENKDNYKNAYHAVNSARNMAMHSANSFNELMGR